MSIELQDIATQTFLLRLLHSIVILGSFIELYRSAAVIKNEKVQHLVIRVAVALFIFVLSRIAATFIDAYYGGGIGWASNFVNVIFWAYVYFKARSIRVKLESQVIGDIGRSSISDSFTQIIEEMERANQRLKQLKGIH